MIIKKLMLKNFKSIGEQTYDFTRFDLLMGRNNSGKSTILQSLAIWQFCVDSFHHSKRTGKKGIQVVLPNFTALPVPEFNLLWKDRTDRQWPKTGTGKPKQEYILIDIKVEWDGKDGKVQEFGVSLRYHSPQAIYAIPSIGWKEFHALDTQGGLPRIAYVPPFSGLEPAEEWRDEGPIRQQVGKAQPGSVLRNLLLRVYQQDKNLWNDLTTQVKTWFNVQLLDPTYQKGIDTNIVVEYRQRDKKNYDIIAGGSGFHQALTLLAFLYGYKPTTILLDEPDAHLHVNLQRGIVGYFKNQATKMDTQFLIATHAEEFAKSVEATEIISLLNQKPRRIESRPDIMRAMADVSNEEIFRLESSPYIIYVEGESDARILNAWAEACDVQEAINKTYFRCMHGGDKKEMKNESENHYKALRQIIPKIKRLVLFDYDTATDWHPPRDNKAIFEWSRKNIENYLLVPEAWKRHATEKLGHEENDLFMQPFIKVINTFFASENLTLPQGKTWRNVDANIFQVVDGKRILFSNDKSLFHQLRLETPSLQMIREDIARSMTADEIHEDVHVFMKKIKDMTSDALLNNKVST